MALFSGIMKSHAQVIVLRVVLVKYMFSVQFYCSSAVVKGVVSTWGRPRLSRPCAVSSNYIDIIRMKSTVFHP
jgi:hypothetical protein